MAVVTALACAATASAGLITTGSAGYCDPDATKAFARWGDSAYYARLLNGGFENGATGWTLSGGAKGVAGNEPYFVSATASTAARCSCRPEAPPTAARSASRSVTGTCAC